MNFFGITSIIICIASLGFGLFLYSSDRKSILNKVWLVFCVVTSIWGLSLYGVTSTNNELTAMRWQYLLDVFGVFVPVTFFAFVYVLLKLKNIFLLNLIIILGSLVALFSLSTYFKTGVIMRYGFFWIEPGKYYLVFPIFFFVVAVTAFSYLIKGYVSTKDGTFRAQILNTLLAGGLGSIGGFTNFFPQIINIYPFGNYFVLLYVVFMSNGVLKYKLLSRRIISAQLLGGAIVLVFLFNLLEPGSTISEWIVKFTMFILISFFSYFLVRGVYKEIEQKEKIEKLADELKEVNRGQNSLIHFMNHQIKGRFGTAKNIFAELLTDDYGTMPPATLPLIKKGLEETNTGINYVQSILKGATAESGSLQYDKKQIDLKNVVEEVIREQKDKIDKKGLKFEEKIESGNYEINADPLQLGEAFRNLIDNSINYTPEGSISVSLTETNGKILFVVKDTGVGITPEDKANLFRAGGRGANSLKVNVNSTGYGLVFVKNVVEAHGGRVWVESEGAGKGSTFYIELSKK